MNNGNIFILLKNVHTKDKHRGIKSYFYVFMFLYVIQRANVNELSYICQAYILDIMRQRPKRKRSFPLTSDFVDLL